MKHFPLNSVEDANNFAQFLIDMIAECLESGKGGTMILIAEGYQVEVNIDRKPYAMKALGDKKS